MNESNVFGLSEKCIMTLKAILMPWVDKIERVAVFGSRAVGKYRPNSDIDLVVYGNLSEDDVNRLWTLLNDSNIPYKSILTHIILLIMCHLKSI